MKAEWKIAKLKGDRDKVTDVYMKLLEKVRKEEHTREDLDRVYSDWNFEEEYARDEVAIAETRFWTALAYRYFVSLPNADDQWERSEQIGARFLTPPALKALRAEVRKERAEQRQDWQFLLPWISTAIGVLGSITGLVAVWRK